MASPMMEQYENLKKGYPDTILLFRLGDFYEGFDEDAKTLSKVLGITLTGRGVDENRKAMAGIPFHALNQYLPKLIKAGFKVAIAEQMEDAKPGQIVAREVTKIITAGTIIDEKSLDESENNYIASIFFTSKGNYQIWGMSYADISTGEFKVCEYRVIDQTKGEILLPRDLAIEISRLKPSELLANKTIKDIVSKSFPFIVMQSFSDSEYYEQKLRNDLLKSLGVENFKGFGLEDLTAGITSAGKLIEYVKENRKMDMVHINKLSRANNEKYMLLDDATIRNLELIYPLRDSNVGKTLYGVINKCQTPMGQRLLRKWLLRPLIDLKGVSDRLDKVDEFVNNPELLSKIISNLNNITDLERVLSKISGKSANARDMLFLASGLGESMQIIKVLKESNTIKKLKVYVLSEEILNTAQTEVIDLITKAIADNPSNTLTEGNIIKNGYNAELDAIKNEANTGKEYIRNLEAREIKRSGISSLKVRFNKVFGYYIEISKSNLSRVPEDYIRKQTLVNGERYITSELKEWEDKVLGAEEKTNFLEYKLFEEIRMLVLSQVKRIQAMIEIIGEIDVLADFARIAKSNGYVKPTVSDDEKTQTEIIGSRHPVVESFTAEGFVENDIIFECEKQQLIVLTGPNMSGKSTYIRQIALIFLMCQIGCFVPAKSAKLVIADRIFTRVGASDNLAGGESTFMVEMNETANILNNATSKSLVILDEVGRGTSTFDGVAIAWSIVEQIVGHIGARTLFATHYHELIKLEELNPSIKNFNIQVIEKNGKISFMHKIIPGGTDKSYGIHVAQIAGIPAEVIERSYEIISKLETESLKTKPNKALSSQTKQQMALMLQEPKNKLIADIISLDINSLTPLDALNILKNIQEKAKK